MIALIASTMLVHAALAMAAGIPVHGSSGAASALEIQASGGVGYAEWSAARPHRAPPALIRRQAEWPASPQEPSVKVDNGLVYSAGGIVVKQQPSSAMFDMDDVAADGPGETSAHEPRMENATMASLPYRCGRPIAYPKPHSCPEKCSYFAEDPIRHCTFSCKKAAQCGGLGAKRNHDVPDHDSNMCRQCAVWGCKKCIINGRDECEECLPGFRLLADGQCRSAFFWPWSIAFVFLGLILLCILAWYASLRFRAKYNLDVHKAAVNYTKQLRLCDDRQDGRPAFRMLDAIHQDIRIGGAGLLLHMDFQCYITIWAALALCGWLVIVMQEGSDMLYVGTLTAETSVETCYAVHHGMQKRSNVLDGKATYVGCLYVCTFAFSLMMARASAVKFRRLDNEQQTMSDYAVFCEGFQLKESGADLEQKYSEYLSSVAQAPVVGVSICWDMKRTAGTYKAVRALIDKEANEREITSGEWNIKPYGPSSNGFMARIEEKLGLDKAFDVSTSSGVDGDKPHGEDGPKLDAMPKEEVAPKADEAPTEDKSVGDELAEDALPTDPEALCLSIESSGCCFAVFETQNDRDRALVELNRIDIPLYGDNKARIQASAAACEPAGVAWENYSVTLASNMRARSFAGVAKVLIGLFVWVVFVYSPIAAVAYWNIASTGQGPDVLQGMLFTIIVAVGNLVMYLNCDLVSNDLCLRLCDDTQAAYCTFYIWATSMNMVVDIALLIYFAFLGLVFRNVRTDDGRLLWELGLEELMFSYPMQKFGAEQVFLFNVGGCFIVPFMLEPFLTMIVLPHLVSCIVRSRAVPFRTAVDWMQPIPMDLGRYADIVLNVTLMCMCFFFSAGYILPNFIGLLVGLIITYVIDRVRVVTAIRYFNYTTYLNDKVAMRLMTVPCGTLLAAYFFNIRQQHYFENTKGWLLVVCLFLFTVHVAIHLQLLQTIYDVPREPLDNDVTYAQLDEFSELCWFASNPVHCLREKYVFKDPNPHVVLNALDVLSARYKRGKRIEVWTSSAAAMAEEPSTDVGAEEPAAGAQGGAHPKEPPRPDA